MAASAEGADSAFPSSGAAAASASAPRFLVAIYLIFKAMGIDLIQVMGGGYTNNSGYESQPAGRAQSNDDMTAFMRTMLAETDDTWGSNFQQQGCHYLDPTLVLFNGQTRSGCGAASAATGPFHCPEDRKVDLDTAFYNQWSTRFGSSGDLPKPLWAHMKWSITSRTN
jgi:hypothetical protein